MTWWKLLSVILVGAMLGAAVLMLLWFIRECFRSLK